MDGEAETKSWKRMSMSEAAEKARCLAVHFMQGQETNGWNWTCSPARPDPIDPQYCERKVPLCWIVLVRFSKPDLIIFDGDSVVRINIAEDTVELHDLVSVGLNR